MKLGSMLKDVLTSLFRPPVTEKYPFEKAPTPERFRGQLFYDPSKCTGCGLCVKDCPSKAIELITLDRAAKRFVVRYHMDRCTYCGQCAVNCKFKCMGMNNDQWELAALKREAFEVYYGKDEDIAAFLASTAQPKPDPESA